MGDLRLPSMNRVTLVGRLTRDPELRYIPSGAAVISFSIAVNRRYKAQNGEWKEDTTFVNVVAWQALAERLNETLKKGSPVFVDGSLTSRSWETQDGQKRSTVEVRAFSVQNLERASAEGKETEETPVEDLPGEPKEGEDIPF